MKPKHQANCGRKAAPANDKVNDRLHRVKQSINSACDRFWLRRNIRPYRWKNS
jgi:hypothetical protein